MKKRLSIICFAALAMAMIMTGCCISHDWAEATCEAPKTCTKCGETEGEALGHTWTEATCETAKTCETCGQTDGAPLGHDFTFATLDAPKTCNTCGKTEGETLKLLSFDFNNWTGENEYFGVIADKIPTFDVTEDAYKVYVRDYDLNVLKEAEFKRIDNCVSCGSSIGLSKDVAFAFTDTDGGDCYYHLYDWDLNLICEGSFEADDPYFTTYYIGNYYDANGDNIYIYPGDDRNNVIATINLADGSLNTNYTYQPFAEIDYDETKWSFVQKCDAVDGYLVVNASDEKMGYVDKDFNELSMYSFATDFSDEGYALVTEDFENYSIIDKDFNVVGKDCIKGLVLGYDKMYNLFWSYDSNLDYDGKAYYVK